jgi:hypothetical protein
MTISGNVYQIRKEYAVAHATEQIAKLEAEAEKIRKAFPELATPTNVSLPGFTKPGPKSMSTAQRKAVSKRMKAFWAAKRAEKLGTVNGKGKGK